MHNSITFKRELHCSLAPLAASTVLCFSRLLQGRVLRSGSSHQSLDVHAVQGRRQSPRVVVICGPQARAACLRQLATCWLTCRRAGRLGMQGGT